MPRRKMLTFKINEISGVDSPAQKPAVVVLMKREADHTHTLLDMTIRKDGNDVPAPSGRTSEDSGHFHAWLRDPDGTIRIEESAGHTHDASVVTKGEDAMTDAEKVALESKVTKAEGDAVAATKRAERAEKVLALPVEQRQHFAKLDIAAQDAFLAKSEDTRKTEVTAAIAKATDADPVVFTSASGEVFRKSDDPRLIAMAKRNDADRSELVKLSTDRAREALSKRADDELGNLPGDASAKIELLKAVDSIPAEHKASVTALLKAANAGVAKAFERAGTGGGAADAGSPEAALETLAKAEATKSGLPYAKAYAKVLETPEGSSLYAKHAEAKAAR